MSNGGEKDQKGNPAERSQNFDPNNKRGARKAPKGIPTLAERLP